MTKSLKEQAKNLPEKPGVYLFKTKETVLYVGKAGNLKSRAMSYFYNDDRKIKQLLNQSSKIDHLVTDSVLEALILEANLIKKYWPFYNVKGKDDKSFAYIAIPKLNYQVYPAPFIIRGQFLKKYPSRNFSVFGPYKTYTVAKNALGMLRKFFPYCDKPNLGRPCFHSQIGLCPGICTNKVSKQEYQDNIKNLRLFLQGEEKRLYKKLKKENPKKIESLKQVQDTALLNRDSIGENLATEFMRIEGYDISHFAGKGSYGSMVVFENNQPDKQEYRLFKIKKAKEKDDVGALKEVLSRRIEHNEWQYPDIILIDGGRGQVNAVHKVIKDRSLSIPIVGIAKGKDKKDNLIFKDLDKDLKKIIKGNKRVFQQVRDEAHRFAKKFSKRKIEEINK
jgi:excinuclease ABC subunit C